MTETRIDRDLHVQNLFDRVDRLMAQVGTLERTAATAAVSGGDGGSGGTFPSGTIVLWYGDASSVPEGWVICNGDNGTPDLRDVFVVGAGGSYSPGDTGGSDTVDLSHQHSVSGLTTDSDSHSHGAGSLTTGIEIANASSGYTDQSVSLLTHTHDVSGSTASDGHSHSLTSGNTAYALSTAEENRPPYHALYWIMKF